MALAGEKRIGADQETASLLPDNRREGCVDLTFGADVEHMELPSCRARRRLDVLYLAVESRSTASIS